MELPADVPGEPAHHHSQFRQVEASLVINPTHPVRVVQVGGKVRKTGPSNKKERFFLRATVD